MKLALIIRSIRDSLRSPLKMIHETKKQEKSSTLKLFVGILEFTISFV